MSDAKTKRLNESQNPVTDYGIADDLHQLVIPKNTTDNLAEVTSKEASIAYDTTLGKVVVNDGSGFVEVGSSGGSGASTALDNLTTTAINQDLIFNTGTTATLKTKNEGFSQSIIVASGNIPNSSVSGDVTVGSGDGTGVSASSTGSTTIKSGNANGNGASSGNVTLTTGTPGSFGARGKIQFVDGSQGASGRVWTSTDTAGSGNWAVPSTGANTSLSNLASPTAVSENLTFANSASVITTRTNNEDPTAPLTVQSADGSISGTGALTLRSGNSNNSDSGLVTMTSGTAANASSGAVVVSSGLTTSSGSSGDININTGA